jgi:hypothetical protein
MFQSGFRNSKTHVLTEVVGVLWKSFYDMKFCKYNYGEVYKSLSQICVLEMETQKLTNTGNKHIVSNISQVKILKMPWYF